MPALLLSVPPPHVPRARSSEGRVSVARSPRCVMAGGVKLADYPPSAHIGRASHAHRDRLSWVDPTGRSPIVKHDRMVDRAHRQALAEDWYRSVR
jgi:hypothetical protein